MATIKDLPDYEPPAYHTSRVSRTDMDEDPLLRDLAFNKHSLNDGHHVSPYDEGRIDIGLDELTVRMVQGINEEDFKRTLSRAQQATIGLPAQGEPDISDWEEMLKGGLQTALESQTIIFEVIGVARATTHQIVRSRRAAFHQQSMRASWFGARPNTRMPESIWRKPAARDAFQVAVEACHAAYRTACDEDVSYQDARYILPIGTETYIMCEYTVREFLAVYAYRACSMFQWEICHTVREMGRLLAEEHPWLKPYIKISCEATNPDPDKRRCTFQGWEQVEDQCAFTWAREDNRTFQPKAHLIESIPRKERVGVLRDPKRCKEPVDMGERHGLVPCGEELPCPIHRRTKVENDPPMPTEMDLGEWMTMSKEEQDAYVAHHPSARVRLKDEPLRIAHVVEHAGYTYDESGKGQPVTIVTTFYSDGRSTSRVKEPIDGA